MKLGQKIHHRLVQQVFGGGSEALPESEEITAWLAKGTAEAYTLPSATIQNALHAFMDDLGASLVSRMKTGYIMHAGSKEMGTLNLKDPLTYQTSLVNSPTFSEGNGMKSNGTTSYINQPFKSNEYAGIESDLTSISYVSEASIDVNSTSVYGVVTTSGGANFNILRPVSGVNVGSMFHHSTVTSFSNSQHKGLYVMTYDGINNVVYKDGVKSTVAVSPVASNLAINRFILCRNGGASGGTPLDFYSLFVAIDFLFDRFSDADELAFRTAFNTYKTAVGLP